ncbi:MAG: TatA/E family twin arginine-targeting protein translocase [Acidobacteriota bacterium]|nr:TatA/E family twin arginine-targeting protein translocase [Acidobacteriota bacterium]MDQ2977809.1 TatA/E family twin arginine-targeting protein translocase [Acidobacteriota bacterium]
MFGSIGMPELILIFIVALLVFGPKKLPEIGKSLGKGLAEFKRASDELKKSIETEIEQSKNEVAAVTEPINSVRSSLFGAPEPVTVPQPPAAPDSAPVAPTAPVPTDPRPITPA